jgi:acyl-CoA hydrolase
VALDDEGKPTEIPQLMAESAEETHTLTQAKERQGRRLKEKRIRESQ